MYKGSNKTYVFDLHGFQNKLNGNELRTPSTKAFQDQQFIRQKNQQSDTIKLSLQQPHSLKDNYSTVKQLAQNRDQRLSMPNVNHRSTNDRIEIGLFNNKSKSTLQIPQPQRQDLQIKNQARQPEAHIIKEDGNFFNVSRRSNMYDFRKTTLSNQQIKTIPNHNQQAQPDFTQQIRGDQSKQLFRPLTPIKENDHASISNIPPPSRSIMDPDNNITFLDNGSRILNPVNIKTPPPPMWGEILEEENYDPNEDFYDHQKALQEQQRRNQMQQKKDRLNSNKRLKKKIVYVYESDSDDENDQKKQKQKDPFLTQSVIHNETNQIDKPIYASSKRGLSIDAFQQRNGNQYNSQFLPSISKQQSSHQQQHSKPPLPSSQQNKFYNVSSSNGLQSRQIRTGGFQKLPTIGLLKEKI